MNIIECTQGSPEWHQHRATHYNASDAPAMLGISPYKSRSQLLHEKSTGIEPEVDAATQRRFDDGHRFEALARTLAEKIIGSELFPVVLSEGKLSASLDGLTMDGMTVFEHKTLSAAIPDTLTTGSIPEHYRAQMEQQLMLSGAERCLFHATKWNDAAECTGEAYCWYLPDPVMRERLLQGWTQFAIDLENYTPPEYIHAAVAAPIKDLPAVLIEVKGEIRINDNLTLFADLLNQYISGVDKEPNDDQGFADMKAGITALKKAEDALEAENSTHSPNSPRSTKCAG